MELKEFYSAIGESYDATYDRLCSVQRIAQFLECFFRTYQIDGLKERIEKQDFSAAMRDAHTLKGVASTLGLERLSKKAASLQHSLKENQNDQAAGLFRDILEEYTKILHVWNQTAFCERDIL